MANLKAVVMQSETGEGKIQNLVLQFGIAMLMTNEWWLSENQ